MATEFVHIKHPDVKTLGGPVTRAALEKIYAPKGWTEATAEDVEDHARGKAQVASTAAALTSESLDGIRKRADLDAIALERGIDPTAYENMDALRDAVRSTLV